MRKGWLILLVLFVGCSDQKGGDTGDTTNACTMYRVMGVCGCGCPFGRQAVRVVDRLMYSKPFYF